MDILKQLRCLTAISTQLLLPNYFLNLAYKALFLKAADGSHWFSGDMVVLR